MMLQWLFFWCPSDVTLWRGLEGVAMLGGTEVIDPAVINARLGPGRLDAHSADRIDVRRRRRQAYSITMRIRPFAGMIFMVMAHDMRATTEAHHQEDEAGPQGEVKKCAHAGFTASGRSGLPACRLGDLLLAV